MEVPISEKDIILPSVVDTWEEIKAKTTAEDIKNSAERNSKAGVVLRSLNTTPRFVFDGMFWALGMGFHTDPLKVEELLKRRGQYEEDVSIADMVSKHYGKQTADLLVELI